MRLHPIRKISAILFILCICSACNNSMRKPLAVPSEPSQEAAQLSNNSEHQPPAAILDNPQTQGTDCALSTPVIANPVSDTQFNSPEEGAEELNLVPAAETPVPENAEPENDTEKQIQAKLDEALEYCRESQIFWQKGELDGALDALDQAYSLILGVDTQDNSKLIQQKEDLRFLISKRILEIYASRNIVVNGNHNAIPLDMNRHVQNEIKLFTHREKNFFIQSYKRSGKYRSMILAALKEAGLPEELSWLPLIESGYKVAALSKARALGLWQFIPSTGYKFGLKRDTFIDERLDPVKATQAAIAYLKELHNIFGDWTTVLAAYNCGEGRVLRVIRDQNVNYLDNFWDLYERLPMETARYVPRFLATLHMVKNPEKYGLDCVVPDSPLEYDTVTVSRQVHLRNVADRIQVPKKILSELNSELRYKITPQDSYELRIPKGKADLLMAEINNIPRTSTPEKAFVYHRVRKGETLSTIAKRYRSSIQSIMRANRLSKRNYIVAGKKLKIPLRGASSALIASTSGGVSAIKGPIPETHVVKRGDSLWIIAKRYATTTKKLQNMNNLKSTRLHIGQVLRIPGAAAQATNSTIDPGKLKVYRVKRGDNPFSIAKINHMKLGRFLQINKLTTSSKIFPGQTVYVE